MNLAVKCHKRFLGPPAFELDVEFVAEPGVTVLFGPSGSGKTTILECIAGLMRPDQGSVMLDSRDLSDLSPRYRKIGYLFQQPALFPHMSAIENVAYGLHGSPNAGQRAMGMLELFHMRAAAQRKPAELSGGERQRVALARTLVTEPAALLLDEPLAALDVPTVTQIVADLRKWNAERNVPIIYVTHAIQEAFALADHVIVLEHGKIVRAGQAPDVLSRDRENLLQLLC
jgi:molybdate transport system ATP-binding protein